MEKQNTVMGMLELILRPAFCVQNGSIVHANHQAQSQGIVIGAPISGLLVTGAEEYAALSNGCLYLSLCLDNAQLGATVTRVDGFDIFVLEPEQIQPELQALALAGQQIKMPLSNIMLLADELLPHFQDNTK